MRASVKKSAQGYFLLVVVDCIHMGTKFHLHVYYTEQVCGVKK